MNWLKKKMDQLSAKLNADDSFIQHVEIEKKEKMETAWQQDVVDNIEALKEITIGAITKAVRMLGYGKAVVSGLRFHSRFADNAAENVSLASIVKDENFIKRIKRDFTAKGIAYKNDFNVEILYASPIADKVTRLSDGIGVEVLTPSLMAKKVCARLVATEGITWESEYILEPSGKQYFIGRCKDPKIENGPKIHNDIAFIGIEEKDEEIYKINNYISRSHAAIVYDKEIGAYKIYRSRFLNNPSHKIKIYNIARNDFSGVTLSQAAVPHVLQHGDSICFNDKIVLEFYLLDE